MLPAEVVADGHKLAAQVVMAVVAVADLLTVALEVLVAETHETAAAMGFQR
jgi:hypothetical protein